MVYLEPDNDNFFLYNRDRGKIDDAPPEEDYCNLRHGFEFDLGWVDLARQLGRMGSSVISYLRANGQTDAYIHANVFKEKFGGLRLGCNYGGLPEPIAELFNTFCSHLEDISFHICEKTGKKGRLRYVGGWLLTLCDEEYRSSLLEKNIDPDAWENDAEYRHDLEKQRGIGPNEYKSCVNPDVTIHGFIRFI